MGGFAGEAGSTNMYLSERFRGWTPETQGRLRTLYALLPDVGEARSTDAVDAGELVHDGERSEGDDLLGPSPAMWMIS